MFELACVCEVSTIESRVLNLKWQSFMIYWLLSHYDYQININIIIIMIIIFKF